jgi:hypothetical protein
MRLLSIVMACAGGATCARVATAAEPASAASDASSAAPTPQPGVVTTREWYGWQTLTVDGASVLLVTGALVAGTPMLVYPGLLGFVAGAPIIHGVHGRPWMAIGDAVLRLVTLPLGAFIGAAVISSHCGDGLGFGICVAEGAFAGAGIGASIPIALDAGVFAYRTHWVDATSPTGLVWQPGVIAFPHGMAAGVSGAF